jgi:hypothetical protein
LPGPKQVRLLEGEKEAIPSFSLKPNIFSNQLNCTGLGII